MFFETLRKYLNDRHERRKDKDYRESAEKRRLFIENEILENEAIAGRIKVLRELGLNDQQISGLVNELVEKPLTALNRYQDSDLIQGAELIDE